MSHIAEGRFEVELAAQPGIEPPLGRMTIAKQFTGDLIGTSRGEMLTAMTGTKGSAGYVAVEHVQGVLAGRSGGFSLMHTGTMDRGAPTLVVRVVPDSGSDGLAGIAGSLAIDIRDGQHCYRLDYTLPE